MARRFVGTSSLMRLAMRRDRVLVPAWITLFVLSAVGSAGAVDGLYPTVADRVEAADAVNSSPSLVAMFGRIYDPTSVGALAMVKMVAFGGLAASVLAALVTVRHSRAEEEAGRLELLGAAVVGKGAPLAAAIATASAAALALGAACALGLWAEGLPAAGCLALGAAWAGVGLVFAGVGAVAAQIARTGRGATGFAVATVGAMYALRAVGDSSTPLRWLSWVSPLGWVHQVRAFAGDRWLVVAAFAAAAIVLDGVALAVCVRRDLGAGLFGDRPGPARGGPRLRSPLGLAWRLERGALAAWTTMFVLLGLLVGGAAENVGSFLDTPTGRKMITRLGGEKGLIDAYLAAELGVIGVITAAYGVHAALRLRTEESAHRADEMLAAGIGRIRWAFSHLLVALVGTTVLAVGAGGAAGGVRAVQTGYLADLFSLLAGALVQLPAVWVVVGISVAAYGVGSRFAIAGWVALALFLLLGEIGPLLRLPQRIVDLSPFAHVPKLPGTDLTALPLVALLCVATALVAGGLTMFRRRDIA